MAHLRIWIPPQSTSAAHDPPLPVFWQAGSRPMGNGPGRPGRRRDWGAAGRSRCQWARRWPEARRSGADVRRATAPRRGRAERRLRVARPRCSSPPAPPGSPRGGRGDAGHCDTIWGSVQRRPQSAGLSWPSSTSSSAFIVWFCSLVGIWSPGRHLRPHRGPDLD